MDNLIKKLQKANTEQEILAALEGTGYSRDEVFVGNLLIYENTTVKYRIVTGSVTLYGNAILTAPDLEVLGGDVILYQNATFTAPKLEVVGGGVFVHENSTFQAPKLEVVGSYVQLYENSTLKAPNLQNI